MRGETPDDAETGNELADRYRLLLELSPDAIAVHEGGVIVYVNSAALDFARLGREEMLGTLITDYVHPSSIPAMVERLAGMDDRPGAHIGPDEVDMVDSHDVVRPMQVTSVRTAWRHKPAYQVILRDVSSQRAAERSLRRQATLIDHVSDAVTPRMTGSSKRGTPQRNCSMEPPQLKCWAETLVACSPLPTMTSTGYSVRVAQSTPFTKQSMPLASFRYGCLYRKWIRVIWWWYSLDRSPSPDDSALWSPRFTNRQSSFGTHQTAPGLNSRIWRHGRFWESPPISYRDNRFQL